MCDPLTIAGLALTAGSTVVNSMAAGKVADARDDVMAAEQIRQRKLDQESDALNATSQDRYTGFEGKQDQKAQQLGDYFQQGSDTTAEAAVDTPPSASNIVNRERTKQLGEAKAYSTQQDTALGNLRAFGDLLGDTSRLQARDAGQIGQIGGFKRGSSGVVPLELEDANNAGAGLKMFGDMMALGGNVATISGLGGKSFGDLFGAATPTNVSNSALNASLLNPTPIMPLKTMGITGKNLGGVGLTM